MTKSLWISGTLYAVFSGVFWWLIGTIVPIGVPMMLNDSPAVGRFATILLCLLAVYTVVSLLFFRKLARSKAL